MSANIQTTQIEIRGKVRTVITFWCHVHSCDMPFASIFYNRVEKKLKQVLAAGVRARIVTVECRNYIEIVAR